MKQEKEKWGDVIKDLGDVGHRVIDGNSLGPVDSVDSKKPKRKFKTFWHAMRLRS